MRQRLEYANNIIDESCLLHRASPKQAIGVHKDSAGVHFGHRLFRAAHIHCFRAAQKAEGCQAAANAGDSNPLDGLAGVCGQVPKRRAPSDLPDLGDGVCEHIPTPSRHPTRRARGCFAGARGAWGSTFAICRLVLECSGCPPMRVRRKNSFPTGKSRSSVRIANCTKSTADGLTSGCRRSSNSRPAFRSLNGNAKVERALHLEVHYSSFVLVSG